MRRGTTPTVLINVSGIDLDDVTDWYIIFQQGDYEIVKETDDITIEDGVIKVPLTQNETLGFRKGYIGVQIRLVDNDGNRIASDIKQETIEGLLWDEVI